MPKENIERAIKKGTGELAGENLEEISIEGFGPGQVALIIEGITDNKNRTLGEIKGILNQYGGKMAGEGAVRWMFERKGCVVINPEQRSKEDLELAVIESGAQDVAWNQEMLMVYTIPESLEQVKKELEGKQLKIESSSLEWVAKEPATVEQKDREKMNQLAEALDENDSVQNIYSNLA
jgi:YebC/PmpR family DNA-binding regulatory protein